MIPLFDARATIGNDHLIPTDDGTDGGAWGQLDLLNMAADNLGSTLVAMGNGLDRLGDTAA